MFHQRVNLVLTGALVIVLFLMLLSSTQPSVKRNGDKVVDKYQNPIVWSSQLLKIEELARQNSCVQVKPDTSTDRTERCDYHDMFSIKLGIYPSSASLGLNMSPEHLYLARLYIQTVKFSLTNIFNINYNGLIDGSYWPPDINITFSNTPAVFKCQAVTMAGLRRIENVQFVLEDIIQRGIKGDFIETGVWKGGMSMFARAVLTAYKQYSRRVLLADSFEGIPPSNVNLFPVDKAHIGSNELVINSASYTGGVKAVRERMNTYFHLFSGAKSFGKNSEGAVQFLEKANDNSNDLDIQTEYLIGYFKDSLPKAVKNGVIRCLAVIRLDGDLYESTWQGLENLYPYLNQGGVIIVDDFTDWIGAFKATHDFRKKMKIDTPIIQVYHGEGETVRGAYFLNPYKSNFC